MTTRRLATSGLMVLLVASLAACDSSHYSAKDQAIANATKSERSSIDSLRISIKNAFESSTNHQRVYESLTTTYRQANNRTDATSAFLRSGENVGHFWFEFVDDADGESGGGLTGAQVVVRACVRLTVSFSTHAETAGADITCPSIPPWRDGQPTAVVRLFSNP